MRSVWLVAVLVGCGGTNPRPIENTTPTPSQPVDDREAVEDTAVLVRSLAFDMYPEWAFENHPRRCPARLAEIATNLLIRDAWGTELRMRCGDDLPQGVQPFGVQSAGADRQFDTDDDVKSWE